MGIFDANYGDKVFATYAGELMFKDRTAGGTPSDPRMIEGWLRTKAGISNNEERRQVMVRTVREMNPGLFQARDDEGNLLINPETATYEQLVEASLKVANEKQQNGFKRPDGVHMAMETRHMKSMIKEVVNINWAHERWGPTKKGAKNFTAERVYFDPSPPTVDDIQRYVKLATARNGQSHEKIEQMARSMEALTQPDGTPSYPEFIFFQRPDGSLISQPDDVETFIGHVVGPKGPQSNLTLVQVVKRGTLRFNVRVHMDAIPHDYWPFIWVHSQENGLGAMRSQSYGRFDLLRFDLIAGDFKNKGWATDPTEVPTEDQIAEFHRARQKAISEGLIAPYEEEEALIPIGAI